MEKINHVTPVTEVRTKDERHLKYIRKECVKKIKPSENRGSFLNVLKEVQREHPETKGACEVLYDSYSGVKLPDYVLSSALQIIKNV